MLAHLLAGSSPAPLSNPLEGRLNIPTLTALSTPLSYLDIHSHYGDICRPIIITEHLCLTISIDGSIVWA